MPASVEEQPEIFQLISSGNLDGLKELFKQNPRAAKIRYTNGVTALLWAARNGQLPTVQWLLAEGRASITEKNTTGSTALLLAAARGQLPVVQWLLAEGGASITEQNTQGATALLCAAFNGHLLTVQWLLAEGGASITEQSTQGTTALLIAAGNGHLPIVQWLLAEGGASITEQGTQGTTALLIAAGNGRLPIVQWLLAEGGARITEQNTNSYTALLAAAFNGHLPIVQWLLAEGGGSITEQNTNGYTALLAAAFNGQLPIVQWLLAEGGASITEQDKHGETALLVAAFRGHLPIVQWLLTNTTVNIHETNKHFKNALQEAMRNNKEETALFLYHYGRPHNAFLNCLSIEKANEFDHLKQTEIGHVRAVAENRGGSLPWDVIKIINSYAFICLSESEEVRLYHYDTVVQQFEVSRTRLSPGTASLFPRFFGKLTLVPADAIPAETDISAMKKNLFELDFLIDYTKNPNVPLASNPINLLVQKEIKTLQEQNKDLTQANATTQQNYIFILKTLRAFLLLGAVAGIVTLITASTLLTGGALTAVVITGGVIGAASTFAFFQTHKAINRQQTALPIQVEETPVSCNFLLA